jgi:hypothetical protein
LTVLPVSPLVEITPLRGSMRGRGLFLLASCLRRWDIRPSPRKDSSELRKDSSELRKDSSKLNGKTAAN